MAELRTCVCGHSPEEHGNDAKHPGSTACDYSRATLPGTMLRMDCDCCAYEAEDDDGE